MVFSCLLKGWVKCRAWGNTTMETFTLLWLGEFSLSPPPGLCWNSKCEGFMSAQLLTYLNNKVSHTCFFCYIVFVEAGKEMILPPNSLVADPPGWFVLQFDRIISQADYKEYKYFKTPGLFLFISLLSKLSLYSVVCVLDLVLLKISFFCGSKKPFFASHVSVDNI